MTTFCHTEEAGTTTCCVAGREIEPTHASVDLATLHRQLSDVGQAGSYAELAGCLAPVFATTSARYVVLCEGVPDTHATASVHTLFGGDDAAVDAWQDAVLSIARQVTARGQVPVREHAPRDSAQLVAWAVPGQPAECLVASFDGGASIAPTALLTLQAVTLQIGLARRGRDRGPTAGGLDRVAWSPENRADAARGVSLAGR